MKYGKYIILALVLAGGLFSCQRDEDIAIAVLNINSEVIEPSYTSANVECYVECNTKLDNVSIEYALTEDFADAQSVAMTEKEGKYRAKCENLLDDTTYYVRYIVSNRLSSMTYKEMSSFRTLKPSIPVVHIDSISNIWDVKAEAFAHIEFDGGAPIPDWGITIWTDEKNDTLFIKSESQERCLIQIQGLQPNTIYYARAYAINKVGVAYSKQEITFTTFALPEVQTYEIADIQLTTAFLSGKLLFNGNDTAIIKGFCWSENKEPTIEDDLIQIDTIADDFSYRLSNLNDETTYQVRAYAKNKIGIAYGEIVAFTTKAAILPTVVTTPTKEVDYHNAIVGGIVTNDGGAEVTERGVVYSTSQNPTTSNTKIISGTGTGLFTCDITNLQEGTTYYVRAYAINKKGTSYGEQKSFTTKAYAVPTVTTSSVTNISYTSATVGGNVTNDGGATVTECGVVYSTNQNPTTDNSKVISGSGIGSFTCNITNLQENTKYYVRAYAINKKGTSYGEQSSFTTKAYILPTVTTSSATDISYTSATVGGNVTNDGGASITERGVVYSTKQNPTTVNSKVISGNGMGSFTCNITNLQENTKYYVRAYAINKKGTNYGEQKSFTTTAYILPTVTTSSATNLSQTSATIGGNVTSDGGANVTERGVVYSTSQNPTTSNSKVICGSGEGDFSCTLTSLNSGTTYYVCAYAVNCKGTSYGNQIRFTTFTTHSYVDLGLSVKWATCNIGAATPEEYGEFFAWGEVEPKENYSWRTYKWYNTTSSTLTKYNTKSTYGIVDNKTQLDISDDAASANWGGDWRMPTAAEWEELRRECTWTWSNKGYKVTSDINGKSIFLPAAGAMNESAHGNQSEYGWYRSSSLDIYDPRNNNGMVFSVIVGYCGSGSSQRCKGCSVRPVCP